MPEFYLDSDTTDSLILPGLELRTLGRPARSQVAIPTKLSRLSE
jgi:hypothetical protein